MSMPVICLERSEQIAGGGADSVVSEQTAGQLGIREIAAWYLQTGIPADITMPGSDTISPGSQGTTRGWW